MAAEIATIATAVTEMNVMFMAAKKMLENARSGRNLSDITR